MLTVERCLHPARNRQNLKRKQNIPFRMWKKRKTVDYINGLPEEILLLIFAHFPIQFLYYNVRLVCKKWQKLSMMSPSWRTVSAGIQTPTHVLLRWIDLVPAIKRFEIKTRDDADVVLGALLTLHSPHLEVLVLDGCYGSAKRSAVQVDVLCNLVNNCKRLKSIDLRNVFIRAGCCKFFELLGKAKKNGDFLRWHYSGYVSATQCRALIRARAATIGESDGNEEGTAVGVYQRVSMQNFPSSNHHADDDVRGGSE